MIIDAVCTNIITYTLFKILFGLTYITSETIVTIYFISNSYTFYYYYYPYFPNVITIRRVPEFYNFFRAAFRNADYTLFTDTYGDNARST